MAKVTQLDDPTTALSGIGPAQANRLDRLGISLIRDFLFHLPRRYEDRTVSLPMRQLQPGSAGQATGEILSSEIGFGKRRSLLVLISDGSAQITCRFFHFSRRQQEQLAAGSGIRVFGEVRFGPKGLEMVHPEYRLFHGDPPPLADALTPVYPITEGISQTRLRGFVSASFGADGATELPGYEHLLGLHQPPAGASESDLEGHRRALAGDELTAYYLVMQARMLAREALKAPALTRREGLGRALLRNLGFSLTAAQRRVLTEVLDDIARDRPMLRLVQGDVGSGKTVIAAFAAIRAAEHGRQTAVMAPTEILAEQHALTLAEWLDPLGISVGMVSGSLAKAQRRAIEGRIESGETAVAVGTHALFSDSVTFNDLALVIIDEQHRFGVHQRLALRAKRADSAPHQLVMTATPIPRTLTMALYADMDTSVIDELPPGRQPVTTRVIGEAKRDEVIGRVGEALQRGDQAYWVCTHIEESDIEGVRDAEGVFAELSEALPKARIALLHGRTPAAEKAETMAAFKAGTLELLVATTVIEVGVNVPNATLMIIENADRLGLAQIHQLRGRVGRGSKASHCLLMHAGSLSETGKARLGVLRESSDGFRIAEEDLRLRGPGELLGTRQTGDQTFRIADLERDADLFDDAVTRAKALLAGNRSEAAQLVAHWSGGRIDLADV